MHDYDLSNNLQRHVLHQSSNMRRSCKSKTPSRHQITYSMKFYNTDGCYQCPMHVVFVVNVSPSLRGVRKASMIDDQS
jgi:hypothetical protein